MCDPVTATIVTATVLAAGTSSFAMIRQGSAMEAQSEFQSQVDKNNAVIAERQAKDALDRGRIEERRQRDRTRQLIGEQRVGFAASGVQLGSGTPLDVLSETAAIGELDALTIRASSEREAAGFGQQQSNLLAQSQLTLAAGRQAKTAGQLGAASTLLGAAAQVGTTFKQAKSAKAAGTGG